MPFDLEAFIEKYRPHKETIDYLQNKAKDGAKAYYEVSIEEARLSRIKSSEKYAGNYDLQGEEKDIIISNECGDGRHIF